MTDRQENPNDLFEKIHGLITARIQGELAPKAFAELDCLLVNNAEARRLYVHYIYETLALPIFVSAESGENGVSPLLSKDAADVLALSMGPCVTGIARPRLQEPTTTSKQSRAIPSFVGSGLHGASGYLSSGWPVAYLIATVVVSLGIAIAAITYVSPSPPSQTVHDSVPHRPSTVSPLPAVVGMITGMADCQWSAASAHKLPSPACGREAGAEGDFNKNNAIHSPVSLGDHFDVRSGLLEITYDTGAKVILQGPVTYEVESASGGYLAIGKLTARLEKDNKTLPSPDSGTMARLEKDKKRLPSPACGRGAGGEGSLNKSDGLHSAAPLFAVRTPTATVTDLGTEFGVEVSKKGETVSHVFRGSITLQVAASDGKVEGNVRVLHTNESARVENCGGQGGGSRITMLDSSAESAKFLRKIPGQTIETLDLVDIVAGGNGRGRARDCGIDLTTGKIATRQPDVQHLLLSSDGRYNKVPERPFVDGVFIPSPGKGPVQLDSAGHSFTGFSSTTGTSWGYIWAGGPYVASHTFGARLMRGLDYSTRWHSLLGMHANKGITFDLDAIRRANPGCKLTLFSAVTGRVVFEEHTGKSGVWVFVDGHARFCREQITQEDGELKVAVALDDKSRFLTLVATDGGDGITFDVVIFGDPKLVLVPCSE